MAQAPERPGNDGTPVFRSGAHVVEVTFIATNSKGQPITDLSIDDLRVFDNRKEQKILSLDRLTAPVAPESARALGSKLPPGRRLSVLLFDALNTPFSDRAQARETAAGVIAQLRSDERIAIFALTGPLKLLHDFSADKDSLTRLIRGFSGRQREARGEAPSLPNPMAAEFSYEDLTRPVARGGGAFGQRQTILDTLQALQAIARLVKRIPGRKDLIWISAGFPLTINSSAGPGDSPFDTESFHTDVSAAMRELNAANVTIYPVDARGLTFSPKSYINVGAMKEMAEQTGGRVFYNANDLAKQVRDALDDSREGFSLTYSPEGYRPDQSIHQIRLQVARGGVQLRYRMAYRAD